MCGISAYIGNQKISDTVIQNTIKALNHRGPDANGVYKGIINNSNIILIHNRLTILDLNTRANQPFNYENAFLIYNGEIYNYIELRKELILLGHKFITNSDTEVVSHALSEWGVEAFKKFEGMWSLIWFNKSLNQIIISRDRFGEKPLYYYKDRKGIYFSSEIKGIFFLRNKKQTANISKLSKYLVSGYKSLNKDEETFYQDIKEFPKGHTSIINKNLNEKNYNYWKPNFIKKNSYSFRTNCEIVRELLINSVKLRLRSDVPLAFCVSSGVDSNALIYIAKKNFNYDVKGFSISSADPRYSEKKLMEEVYKKDRIDCTYIKPTKKNFLSNLKKIINQHDSPISTISYYLHWQLLKKISEKKYKVSISGTGADEIFSGYYDHFNFYLAYLKKKEPKLFNKSLKDWYKFQYNSIRNPFIKDPYLIIKNNNFRKHIYQDTENFSNFFYNKTINRFKEKNYKADLLRNRMLNELFFECVPVILKEDDLNSMNFSVENRSPFLDKNLFEFAMTIPTKYLINEGFGKNVLRKSLKGIVNDKILDQKKKIGFNASISELVNFKNKKDKEIFLDNSSIFKIIKKKSVEKLISKGTFTNSESKFLFNFINAKIFLENIVK